MTEIQPKPSQNRYQKQLISFYKKNTWPVSTFLGTVWIINKVNLQINKYIGYYVTYWIFTCISYGGVAVQFTYIWWTLLNKFVCRNYKEEIVFDNNPRGRTKYAEFILYVNENCCLFFLCLFNLYSYLQPFVNSIVWLLLLFV